jgi:uncharacterized protein
LELLPATTTAIGGPPLALAFQTARSARLRGTLSACFVPGGVFSQTALAASGRFGWSEAGLGASLMPAIVIGFMLSGPFGRFLDRGWLRPTLLSVSAAAAVVAIVRAVLPGA